MDEKVLFTTGEFAKLCGTTKETLRHYHNKGILTPKEKNKSGYYYYSAEQFFDFDLIALLVYAGNSLRQIQEYLQSQNTENFLTLMDSSKRRLQDKKKKTESMLRTVENITTLARYGLEATREEITIQTCEKEYYIIVPISEDLNQQKKGFFEAFSKLWEHDADTETFGEYPYSYLISKDSFKRQGFLMEYIAMKLEKNTSARKTHEKPAGDYATLFHHGSSIMIGHSCQKLYDYISSCRKKIEGPLYIDELINSHVTQNKSEHIAKLSIKVSPF